MRRASCMTHVNRTAAPTVASSRAFLFAISGSFTELRHKKEFRTFIVANAEEIMNGMESPDYTIGVRWTAPHGVVNASTQSSGEDALVTALMVQGRPVLP